MKRLAITVLISLIVIGISIFFLIRNKNDLMKKQRLIPRLSTLELPSATVGSRYEADIFASMVGAKAKMQIIGINIPTDLSITDCNQSYNNPNIPKPNTVINCKLVGMPREGGQFEVSFKVEAKDYKNSVSQKYNLDVVSLR